MDSNCSFCQRINLHGTAPEPDTIWSFRHSVAYLGRWQYYHGYTVLIARQHATELNQLADDVRHAFFDEMCLVARALESEFKPQKLNYEILGNQVPHLHWHVFPRYSNDPDAKLPVWLATVPAEASDQMCRQFEAGPTDRTTTIAAIRSALARWVDPVEYPSRLLDRRFET